MKPLSISHQLFRACVGATTLYYVHHPPKSPVEGLTAAKQMILSKTPINQLHMSFQNVLDPYPTSGWNENLKIEQNLKRREGKSLLGKTKEMAKSTHNCLLSISMTLLSVLTGVSGEFLPYFTGAGSYWQWCSRLVATPRCLYSESCFWTYWAGHNK